MRETGKILPFNVELEHDLVAYISQIKECTVASHPANNFRTLGSMPAATLKVSSQKNLPINSLS